ncbi:hypothetical protein PNOK_0418500 [Pyrrhoderma noxium]|uniref:DUF6533 domain-containing protein n=1 Tax=Pyrrhoderma noxium TaxID=2282107 RepID=A0A286UI21_9AGAM|nr:hypothetical protein PNOK_0418500 [Pyrrhoderma noxium]
MSNNAIIQASTHYLKYKIQWSSIALIYYDYAIRLPDEVQHIWKRKFGLTTLFYFLCVQILHTYNLHSRSWFVLLVLGSVGFFCIVADWLHVPWDRCVSDPLSSQ